MGSHHQSEMTPNTLILQFEIEAKREIASVYNFAIGNKTLRDHSKIASYYRLVLIL